MIDLTIMRRALDSTIFSYMLEKFNKWRFCKPLPPTPRFGDQYPKRPLILLCAISTLSFAQTTLETVFNQKDLNILEQLVTLAQAHDPTVIEADFQLKQQSNNIELLGRLKDALSINASTNIQGDYYGQASPSYSIGISLDVLNLIPKTNTLNLKQATLEQAKAQARVQTIQAFLSYKIALETAESAAHALESSETAFRAVQARVEMGEATLSDQLRAQTTVSDAAIRLLNANANVINSFETLAATTGQTPEGLKVLLNRED